MKDKYKFTVTKTYHYYGYPQAEDRFKIEGVYCVGSIRYYGNCGFDAPKLEPSHSINNGYFWSMHALIKDIFCGSAFRQAFKLKEGESMDIVIEG